MKKLLLVVTIATTHVTYAQLDTFNINTSTSGVVSSLPEDFIIYNSDLYFSALDFPNGGELRRIKNGTSTIDLLSDTYVGRPSGITGTHHSIKALGNIIYFGAKDTLFNTELWQYDGTSATLAAEIYPGTDGAGVNYMTIFDEKLFFVSRNKENGGELWSYDPATKSASLVVDLNPGTNSSTIHAIEPYNGKLYFAGNNGTSGNELQEYDPVTKKTTLIKDINPGIGGAVSRHMLTAGGKLYFIAGKSAQDFELYSYDGSNVVQVTDLNKNGTGVSIWDFHKMMIEWNGSLYFEGYDSTNGFYHLCEYNLSNGNISFHPIKTNKTAVASDYAIYNNKLFFAATDGTNGIELWSYDGTNPPKMAYDIDPGLGDSKPQDLIAGADGYLYFSAELYPLGRELFRYKDTATSIEKINQTATDITLYPNPAKDHVQIEFSILESTSLTITLTDMQGRVVYNTTASKYGIGKHKVTIPLNDIPIGSYVYQLTSNKNLIAGGKFIKE